MAKDEVKWIALAFDHLGPVSIPPIISSYCVIMLWLGGLEPPIRCRSIDLGN